MVTSRIWFTAKQKADWERWKNGQSVLAISRALERRNKTGVERIVVLHGGIAPAPRRRAVSALRLEEREEISREISVGRSLRQIARGPQTIAINRSREIRRNGGTQVYRANRAERSAWERPHPPHHAPILPEGLCPGRRESFEYRRGAVAHRHRLGNRLRYRTAERPDHARWGTPIRKVAKVCYDLRRAPPLWDNALRAGCPLASPRGGLPTYLSRRGR